MNNIIHAKANRTGYPVHWTGNRLLIWRAMKLTLFLTTLLTLQISASTLAQRVDMDVNNASFRSVMITIQKQTGYSFVANEDLLKKARPVSLTVRSRDIIDALPLIFKGQPFTYQVHGKVITLKEIKPVKSETPTTEQPAVSVQDPIQGRVTNDKGEPLGGATIYVLDSERKRTSTLTITDREGNFRLDNVQEGVLLEVTYLGHTAQTVPARAQLGSIALQAFSAEVGGVEVVSTGYQQIPRERATGSFSTVSNELFNQQVGTDILSRLPAIANSMVMDNGTRGTPQMMVRGLSTIQGPKDPLIIVDNFPYDGDLTNINPNIVENITILKDASASSIWGARAANGVIVITTKTGNFNQPITLDFNSNLTIGAKPNLGYIRQMSSNDYIDMEQELFSRDFYNSQIDAANRPVLSPVVDLLNKVRLEEITDAEAQQQIDQWRTVDARDQFNQYMYSPSVNQQYFLSARGGADKFSWTSAVGYDHNKDNLGSTYQRINLRFQNTYRPIKQLSLSTGLLYTQNQNRSGRLGYSNVSMRSNNFVPYMLLADAAGNALPVAKNWNQDYIETAGDGMLLDWKYYPLTDWKHETSHRAVSDVLATAIIDYQIIQGLNATVNYQYERQFGLTTSLADESSFTARDNINRFAQVANGTVDYIVPRGGRLNKSNSILNANNLRGSLNFDNSYGQHNITAIAGAEIRAINTNGYSDLFYGYDPNNLTIGNVDYTKAYPTRPNGSGFIQRGQSLYDRASHFVSQFANAAYMYQNKYVISASARRDASNLFGLKANDQWNPFWSAGFAWKLSNEKFYNVDLLPYVNFRSTYGFSGNIDPAMVAVNTISYASRASLFNGEHTANFSNYYNPQLRWETSKMLNLAVDFRTRNDRLSGSVEHYRKRGENLFGVAPTDYTTGVPPWIVRNVASMKGSGWDVELRSLNIDRTLKWRTILNFSTYRDEIKEYLITRTRAALYISTFDVPISGIEGKPVHAMYAYRWAGLDPTTGEAQGYLGDEVSKDYTAITGTGTEVEDLEYFGSAIPTKFGSLINSISYKNFNLQFGISFKLGYWFRRNSINYTSLFNNWDGHSDYAHRWRQPGDETKTNVPVNLYTANSNRDGFYTGSSVLVEKGDHIRLQYVNLSYDLKLPQGFKGGIKGVQLYVNGSNFGLLWRANKAHIDPDFNIGANSLVTPTNYAVGIRTKF